MRRLQLRFLRTLGYCACQDASCLTLVKLPAIQFSGRIGTLLSNVGQVVFGTVLVVGSKDEKTRGVCPFRRAHAMHRRTLPSSGSRPCSSLTHETCSDDGLLK